MALELPPNRTPESPKVTCDQVIKACDKALAAKDSEIKASDEVIKVEKALNLKLQTKVGTDEEKLSSPVRSPIVMVGLGLLGGIISPFVGVGVLAAVVVGTSL